MDPQRFFAIQELASPGVLEAIEGELHDPEASAKDIMQALADYLVGHHTHLDFDAQQTQDAS